MTIRDSIMSSDNTRLRRRPVLGLAAIAALAGCFGDDEAPVDDTAADGDDVPTSDDDADDTADDGVEPEPAYELPPNEPEVIVPEGTGPFDGPTDDDWTTEYVGFENGWLTYLIDDEHNRIPDFSCAGYHRGEKPIPDVETVETIGPVAGDNREHIRDGLRRADEMRQEEGLEHAALELEPGLYYLYDTLAVSRENVILRGAGDGTDPAENSILVAVGEAGDDYAMRVGASSPHNMPAERDGPEVDITTDIIRAGDRSFEVEDASAFDVGDNIAIEHPATREWIDAIDGGGTAGDSNWSPGDETIVYSREIIDIDGDAVTVDAPSYNFFDRSLSQPFIYPINRSGVRTEIGIEDLRVEILATGNRQRNDDHYVHGIVFRGVEDAWARGCTVRNFQDAGFQTRGANRITIRDCRAQDPFGEIVPPLRYNFDVSSYSNLILFDRCFANRGRHCYISNGTSVASGLVFKNVIAEQPAGACEAGHRRWTQGVLFDQYVSQHDFPDGSTHRLHIGNRGDWGTAHGWGAVHSLAWNSEIHEESGSGFVIENPPTAQNYSFGGTGPVAQTGPFGKPQGHIEGHDEDGIWPHGLYLAQLEQRMTQWDFDADEIDAALTAAAADDVRDREVRFDFFVESPSLSVPSLLDISEENTISASLENVHEDAYDEVSFELWASTAEEATVSIDGEAVQSTGALEGGETAEVEWSVTVEGDDQVVDVEFVVQATAVVDGSHRRVWDRRRTRAIPADPDAAVYETDFGEDDPGVPPADWTTRMGRHEEAWIVEEDGDATGDRIMTGSENAGSAFQPIQWDVVPTPVRDVEVLVRVKMPTDDGSGSRRFRVYTRAEVGSTDISGYYAELDPTAGEDGTYGIYAGANEQEIRAEEGVPGNEWLWLRFQCDGATQRLKVWEEGESEPNGWDLQVSDGTNLSGEVLLAAHHLPSEGWPLVDVVAVGVGGDSPD